MARLNRAHRGVEGPTDVLAFPLREGPWSRLAGDTLGDVVISAATAHRQAREAGTGPRAELALLLIHGILHLLGYDHGSGAERRRMWRKQRAVLLACGIQSGRAMRARGGPRRARPSGREREP
jgi:probable rRNA maturation factor